MLARPQPSTDYAGIALALLAACCWAGYILVNRVVGARIPGAQGPAAAAALSAVAYIPAGIWVLASHPVTLAATGRAAVAGVMCSAVPMVADLRALRRVPARFFGAFMSVNPAFAALTGLIVLGQSLAVADWLAIAAIVAANGLAVSQGAARHRPAAGAPAAGTQAPEALVSEALSVETLAAEMEDTEPGHRARPVETRAAGTPRAVESPGTTGCLTGRGR